MSIIIKTEKIVKSTGEFGRKIIEIKMLEPKNLPALYKTSESKPVFTTRPYENEVKCFNRTAENCRFSYDIGSIYSEKEFQGLLQHCREAGEHLGTCNKELAGKRKVWNGPETFVI